jgi:hypothetical protein
MWTNYWERKNRRVGRKVVGNMQPNTVAAVKVDCKCADVYGRTIFIERQEQAEERRQNMVRSIDWGDWERAQSNVRKRSRTEIRRKRTGRRQNTRIGEGEETTRIVFS